MSELQHRSLGWTGFSTILLLSALSVSAPTGAAPDDEGTDRPTRTVAVVCTLPVYASLAAEVGGSRVEVRAIARADEDAHFVKPKPSLALMLRDADLFVTTGLDLELWAPVLVDKSGNRKIVDGQPGFVSASQGVPLRDVPENPSRAAGDVHIYGNPHIFTSPLNAKIIAGNIAAGLIRVDPAGEPAYRANLERLERRLDEATFGRQLVALLGGPTLDALARQGKLMTFLDSQEHEGRKLRSLLGGWLEAGMVFRDRPIVAYHTNWSYFADLFGLDVVDYVESKPGIPPSARHVHELIQRIDEQRIPALLVASYFDERRPKAIAERTGCRPIFVPLGTGERATTYFDLVDLWVGELVAAYGG